MINFKMEDYVFMGRWAQPVLPGVVWCRWNETESVKRAGYGQVFENQILLDGNFFYKTSDHKKIERLLDEVITSNMCQSYCALLDEIGREVEQNHLRVPEMETDLNGYLSALFNTYAEVTGFWNFTLLLGDVMNDYFLKHTFADSSEDMISKLSPYARRTWLEDQPREIQKMARALRQAQPGITANQVTNAQISEIPELSARIDQHVMRFSWFGTHHWLGDAYNRAKCINDIANVIGKKPTIEKRVSKDGDTVSTPLWELLAAVSYWRTHCAEITSKVVFASRPRLTQCATRLSLTYEQLLDLTPLEIRERISFDRFDANLPPNYEERRTAYGCYINGKGRECVITGVDLQKLVTVFIKVADADVRELSGVVASAGKTISGSVVVLISSKDFVKFKRGAILVAPETTPDFVPYMKLASAIVTDRGGITSHAAIVSRELGIPCVVGTKIATQVFKDCDRVEVDATNGVVRKIGSK
ncbi:MAG: hypothetical protein A3J59_01195 [Candidatus Buchananbacteria bacterium RIFCSPHIGHO2_02_FULL_56_16]|uniref:PEP-utilising enzyme mobile domain-containing protein n=1 Tax=Candidatus Buchananbacteria bacterium RIFCSPHIGHO2_02_FULL_56_16 TaxID=1797542 RepID=A0A1G1YDC9_9BACT|nr:MAG: hypothetical protein A3J59_01195 [Candidatus Buchananbacteria bacterium RIFCSPHIGHO2_02_FULL_56_16]